MQGRMDAGMLRAPEIDTPMRGVYSPGSLRACAYASKQRREGPQ